MFLSFKVEIYWAMGTYTNNPYRSYESWIILHNMKYIIQSLALTDKVFHDSSNIIIWKLKLGFYVLLTGQGHIGIRLLYHHLWESIPHRGDKS